ncbi:MAG TPA: tail fiber domain-containing protein [Opitutus sp.]|nr:tail fiber domain-containing protein [Opitutus sp.]
MKAPSLSSLSLIAAVAFASHAASGADWTTVGNSGTNPATNFIGTTDDKPLELRVNKQRVLRLEKPTADTVNLLAGSHHNVIVPGVKGVTIAGGGAKFAFNGTPLPNAAASDFSTIGGGGGNEIGVKSEGATIVGGLLNTIGENSYYSFVGGLGNEVGSDSYAATIAGGRGHNIYDGADFSTVVGGETNRIGAGAGYAVAVGGSYNQANAPYTFAAGSHAIANHAGSFVWAGRETPPGSTTGLPYSSEGPNEFRIRAKGGVHLSNGTSLNFGSQARQMINLWNKDYGIGVQTNTLYQRTTHTFAWYQGGVHHDAFVNPGAGKTLMLLTAWGLTVNGTLVSKSDRDAKENFAPVDAADVLAKVVALPISRWSYKDDERKSLHVGPMAQDFHAAFHLGEDDKHIATVDADGIALAAIQARHAELKARDATVEELNRRLARMESLVERLTAAQ